MRRASRVPAAILAVFLAAAHLAAGTTSGATRTLTFAPVADATIRADRPTRSYGTTSSLSVDGTPAKDVLLRVTVSGVGSDLVTGAVLRLYATDSSPVAGTIYRVGTHTWTETVTWNSAPAADPSPIVDGGAAVATTWSQFDLVSLITGDGTYSMRITSTSANGADYVSREGTATQRPEIVVTTTSSPDTTPPSVAITAPAAGATVAGSVPVTATAADDTAVTTVDFAVDGSLIGSDPTSPYEATWDSTGVADGAHALTAIAHDAAGHATTSDPVAVTVANPVVDTSFTFAAAGDHGANPRTAASFAALDASPASLYLALGDLDYDETATDQAWCDYVHQRLPMKGFDYPFEVVAGNHEDDLGPHGAILDFAACLPDRLNSSPGPGSAYGAEYSFDYPAAAPLARFIMISPELTVNGTTYHYVPGNAHHDWLVSTIDAARAAGIPWVIVGSHFPCLTAGVKQCDSGSALMNLLVDRRVDLVLHGHEHSYQRSKQLALQPQTCPSIASTGYNASCVADDGLDGIYPKGAGSVDVIAGTFGRSLYPVSRVDPEGPYFAAMDGTSNGFVQYEVSAERLDATFVSGVGTFSDSFSIVSGAVPNADRTPPTEPTGLVADTTGAGRVNLSWAASSDVEGIAFYAVSRDGAGLGSTSTTTFTDPLVTSGQTYTYAVTAYDGAFNPSTTTPGVTVTVPIASTLTFEPEADATLLSGNPTTNYGATTTLLTDGSSLKAFLIRFTVSGVGTRSVGTAKLRLACIDNSPHGGTFNVASNAWAESAVTWNASPPAGASVASLGQVVSGTAYEVDLSSLIQGDGTYTLRVESTNPDGADYTSREGLLAGRPILIVAVQ